MAQGVVGLTQTQSQRKYRESQQQPQGLAGEVAQDLVQRMLGLVQAVLDAPLDQRQVGPRAAVVLELLEDRRGVELVAQGIGKTTRQLLLALEGAAEQHQADIGDHGEGRAHLRQPLEIAPGAPAEGTRRQVGTAEAIDEGPRQVADKIAHMPGQRAVEALQVVLAGGFDLPHQPGVAANRALAEDDHAAGQDVGALDGDPDRKRLVAAPEVVVRPHADAAATVHIHGIVDHLAHLLGIVILENGGDHRGLFAPIQGRQGQQAPRIHEIGQPAHARQRFLDALKAADRNLELLADTRIGAGGAHRQLARAGTHGRKRDATTGGQGFHQHAPALADHLATADDEIQRDEYIAPPVRPVHEGRVERKMPLADLDTGQVRGHQRAGDAEFFLVAEQVIGVIGLEGDAEHGGHRTQGDISLVPVETQAKHLLPFEIALADHAAVGNGAGVGAGFRRGEGETGDLAAVGQARQVIVALFIGAIVQQQFRGAEGVGHHHRHAHRDAARRNLHHHLGMGRGGEFQPAVALGNDHAEETVLLEEVPHLRRQILAVVGDVPVVDPAAEFLHRPVDEGALFLAETGARHGQQPLPVGVAAEQFRFPAHRARLDGVALGLRHGRQHLAYARDQRFRQVAAAPVRYRQQQHRPQPQPPGEQAPGPGKATGQGEGRQRQRGQQQPVSIRQGITNEGNQ